MTRRKPSRLTTGRLQLLRLFSTLLAIALIEPDGERPNLNERYRLLAASGFSSIPRSPTIPATVKRVSMVRPTKVRLAAECEERAKQASEPEAAKLREEALLCREWIAALRSGKWHS